MDKDELHRRLMKTFLLEIEEHLEALEHGLLELERDPDAPIREELHKSLFRAAHTLKGAARSVNIDSLEEAGHHLESVFARTQDGTLRLDAGLFKLLFAAVDAIRDAARQLANGRGTDEGSLSIVLHQLHASLDAQVSQPAISDPSVHGTKAASPSISPDPRHEAPVLRADETVRIPSNRLDRLLELGSDLMAVRRRSEAREADVASLIDWARRWETDCEAAERTIGRSRTGLGTGTERSSLKDGAATSPAMLLRRNRESLHWLMGRLESLFVQMAADRKAMDQVASPLEEVLFQTRMTPVAETYGGFERAVRDLAKTSGKEVVLTTEGGEIEIDRVVAAEIRDPLLHLLRNAVGHGIEPPEARLASGKPAQGQIRIAAMLRSGRVEVVVADDGRGFDLDSIREQAHRRGLPVPEDHREAARLAFAPGLSTASEVTLVSGRGVGLDIVRTTIESLRGQVHVTSAPGKGTRFVLSLPLTLSRLRALLFAVGGHIYAFDATEIHQVLRLEAEEPGRTAGREVFLLDGRSLPLVNLAEVLGRTSQDQIRPAGKRPAVVVRAGSDLAAFRVDELLAEQDVVVKDLGLRLRGAPLVTGGTILPTGQVALILSATDLARAARVHESGQARPATPAATSTGGRKRLILAEDSLTTRTLIKSVLESAGYSVTAVPDGLAAWQVLQESGADLVVSDVEMPRMNGYSLTEAIRSSDRHRHLPVILLTSRDREADKLRGWEAGASAYLVKSAFDQADLIKVIKEML